MATQVVMFSVLLFGTSGIVLDFGRVYSEHSNMQSFTDQAALAAAAELDRKPGSIGRAVDAVFGGLDAEGNDLVAPMTKTAVFSSGADNQFNISHLVFLSDLPNDAGAQTSMAGIQSDIVYVAFADGGTTGDAATAESEAKYVIAVAEERSVSNTLISLINSGAETATASSNIVRTVAAAKREVSFCGEFSNLVMCSPRSAMQGANAAADNESDLGAFMNYHQGARFAHITDYLNGSEQHRLYRRRNPAMDADDDGGMVSNEGVRTICNTLNTLPGGATAIGGQLETYQAICHLAAATPRDHCIGDTLEIVAAEPEVITTALNVAFNMWDEPINEVIEDWPGTPFALSMPFFQPDLLIMKGKIWETDATVRNATNILHALNGNHSSRLHYKTFFGKTAAPGVPGSSSSSNFDLNLPDCLRSPATQLLCGSGGTWPGIAPFIGNPATQTALNQFYQENYPDHYEHVNNGLGVDGLTQSFYDMYLQERSGWTHASLPITSTVFNFTTFQFETTTVVAAGAPLTMIPYDGATPEDASLAATTPPNELESHTNELGGTAGYPSGIVDADPFNQPTRRRLSVPLVNCDAMTDPDGDGIFEADVLEFVDVFLMQPPRPVCLNGTDQCNNSDIISSTVFTELIGKTNYVLNDFPELVR